MLIYYQEPETLKGFKFDRTFLQQLDPDMIVTDPIVFTEKVKTADDQIKLVTRSAYLITRPDLLRKLGNCKTWMIDATFFASPRLSSQVMIVYGDVNGTILPLAYIVMNGKSTKTYMAGCQLLFGEMRKLKIKIKVENILTDYEVTIMNVFSRFLPASVIFKACYFHKRQNTVKNLQTLGLMDEFKSNATFADEINQIDSLIFVKPEFVESYFEELYADLSDNAKLYADFLKKNYIGGYETDPVTGVEKFKKARYPIKWWNLYEWALKLHHFTTSPAENNHKNLNREIATKNRPIYKFLIFLKTDFGLVRAKLSDLAKGTQLTRPSGPSAEKNEKIKQILLKFDVTDPTDLLARLAFAVGSISKVYRPPAIDEELPDDSIQPAAAAIVSVQRKPAAAQVSVQRRKPAATESVLVQRKPAAAATVSVQQRKPAATQISVQQQSKLQLPFILSLNSSLSQPPKLKPSPSSQTTNSKRLKCTPSSLNQQTNAKRLKLAPSPLSQLVAKKQPLQNISNTTPTRPMIPKVPRQLEFSSNSQNLTHKKVILPASLLKNCKTYHRPSPLALHSTPVSSPPSTVIQPVTNINGVDVNEFCDKYAIM